MDNYSVAKVRLGFKKLATAVREHPSHVGVLEMLYLAGECAPDREGKYLWPAYHMSKAYRLLMHDPIHTTKWSRQRYIARRSISYFSPHRRCIIFGLVMAWRWTTHALLIFHPIVCMMYLYSAIWGLVVSQLHHMLQRSHIFCNFPQGLPRKRRWRTH